MADINAAGNAASPLHLSLLYGSTEHAKALLSNKNVDCNQPMGDDKNTILHVAAFRGDMSLLKEVLKRPDVDVNAVNAKGQTALHIAVEQGNLTAVDMLTKSKNCDLNVQDQNGHTPLSMATSENIAEKLGLAIIKLLIKRGADVAIDSDYTLMQAVNTRSHRILDSLVNNGAKLSSENQVPFESAVAHGDRYAIKRLVKANGDVNHVVNHQGDANDGLTLLMLAIKNEKLDSVKALLESGCNPEKYDSNNSRTPLHILASNENREFSNQAMKLILSSGPGKNKEILSKRILVVIHLYI